MPNWCMNKMTIKGNDLALSEFAFRMKKRFSLEKILPTPKKFLEDADKVITSKIESKADMPDWYNWRLQHWGTKWEITNIEHSEQGAEMQLKDNGKTYSCEFDSAWNPPLIALEYLSKQIPDLEISLDYHDEMMNYTGRASFLNGDSDFVFEQPEPQFGDQIGDNDGNDLD